MKLRDRERLAIINELVTNGDGWKAEGDRELLDSFPDDKLVALKAEMEKARRAVTVANAAVAGFSDGQGNAFRINPETNRWERAVIENNDQARNKSKAKTKPAPAEEEEEEEEPDGGGMTNGDRGRENRRRMAGKGGRKGKSAENRREEETEREPRARRPRTPDEWLRTAPVEIQSTLRVAREIEQREKDKIINEILTNVSEKERPIHRSRLQQRSLPELEDDRALFPKQPTREEVERAVGNAAKPRGPELEDDMLITPTINWQEVGSGEASVPSPRNAGTSTVASVTNDGSEEEWLRNAPASIRVVVQNAMAVDARERGRLLDEIVANSAVDEDTERRLLARYKDRPLDELRDLVALLPGRSDANRQPLYLGQSAPVGNAVENNTSEDLLPLPSMTWEREGQGRRRDA